MGRCIQYRYEWTDREYLEKTEKSRLMNGMSYEWYVHVYAPLCEWTGIYIYVCNAGRKVGYEQTNELVCGALYIIIICA